MTDNVQQLAMVRHLARTGEARRRRLAARLSLSEVAEAIGVTEATVSRWERSERLPKGDNALAFLEVLQAIDDTPRRGGASPVRGGRSAGSGRHIKQAS